tara:strand:+ start:620 stop:961 length:342 start_codon:yes stop_codon:yes gene_type:complete
MGLDQHLLVRSGPEAEGEVVFSWRKHYSLQGFLAEECARTGTEPDNPGSVAVTEPLLARWEISLHPSEGFGYPPSEYWGVTAHGEYDDQDRKALEFCKGALARGQVVWLAWDY